VWNLQKTWWKCGDVINSSLISIQESDHSVWVIKWNASLLWMISGFGRWLERAVYMWVSRADRWLAETRGASVSANAIGCLWRWAGSVSCGIATNVAAEALHTHTHTHTHTEYTEQSNRLRLRIKRVTRRFCPLMFGSEWPVDSDILSSFCDASQ